MAERVINEALNKPDKDLDVRLRPSKFRDFVGQKKAHERLELFVQAAKGRGDVMEHVLLSGPPGLGKTTLATIIGLLPMALKMGEGSGAYAPLALALGVLALPVAIVADVVLLLLGRRYYHYTILLARIFALLRK